MKTETLAKLACAFSGLVWGLFWIPIRALAGVGVSGIWATLIFYVVPLIIVLPLLLWRWRAALKGGPWLQGLALVSALSLVLYSISILYTDIVRAMLLFYLTPLWSTLLARLILREPITGLRWLAMAIGIAGMLVIFRVDAGLPFPERLGDWLALMSGVLWAVASVMLRADRGTHTIELFTLNFLWSAIVALGVVLVIDPEFSTSPPLRVYFDQLPWLLPVIVTVVMSGVYTTMWGAPKLSPGIVGLLFMTEISVGAVTAALWSGDPFGWREAIGIVLITAAGALESLWSLVAPCETRLDHAR
ncbi:MAG: DMT family transporter [Hyphomicrobiales bacterium]